MPDSYASRRARQKVEILARVAAGASVQTLAREPGLPCAQTVTTWGRADPTFRHELRMAARRRTALRQAFDPILAEAFLARYRAGEPMGSILADPAMPTKTDVQRWRTREPPFAEEVRRIKALYEPARKQRLGRARIPRPFDQADADAVLVAIVRGAQIQTLNRAHPHLPGRDVVYRWRREQPEFAAEVVQALRHGKRRHGRAAQACAALEDRIVAGLVAGGSFSSLSRQPGMPRRGSLSRWYAQRPDFRAKVDAACQAREDSYVAVIAELARTVTPENCVAVGRQISELKRQVARLNHRPGRKKKRRS